MGGTKNPASCSFCEGTRGMLDTFIADCKRWVLQPYNEEGTAFDWFLFIGLMVISTFLWSRVLRRILD